MNKLKERWGIKGTFHVIIILLVFAATGMSTLKVEGMISQWLKLSDHPTFINRFLVFVFLTLPIYNILLLIIGTLFGQFSFFWNFEKRFFSSFGKLFRLHKSKK
ncbi:MAG: diacylglyceryl transferase [Bacteroidetes bacterium]|nr:diacylglyceryl transferase [Bacteroidota bacterium]MBL6963992.1 diacylglyceryl transferase [Bacteroidota bacterium]